MSASTERLVEQIRATEAAIVAAQSSGQDASELKRDLQQLQRRLATSNDALNEGKQVLKG